MAQRWVGRHQPEVYRKVNRLKIHGLEEKDKVILRSVDSAGEDITLFTPLWAHLAEPGQAQEYGYAFAVGCQPLRPAVRRSCSSVPAGPQGGSLALSVLFALESVPGRGPAGLRIPE